ncbi:MAG: M18 family aminopeptidase [Bacteroides sp.]|nr:M18 family aminopeptidase [Bacteroides sp.]
MYTDAARRMCGHLDASVCNFFAVRTVEEQLRQHGYRELDLSKEWNLEPAAGYYVKRNDSALIAFRTAASAHPEGFNIIAAHTDSPGFKLKPNPEIYGDGGMVSLNVEKYGGAIMYTWFDRPLSMAGRLMLRTADPMRPEVRLVDLKRPVAVIPHLAIHFNRQVNEGNRLSVQKDMKPVLGEFTREEFNEMKSRGGIVRCMLAEAAGVAPEDILSSEIVLYPCLQNAVLGGVHEELIMSPRLDDLSMAFCGLQALLESEAGEESVSVLALFDNEETGSGTRMGAAAPTLRNVLERISRHYSMPGGDELCPDWPAGYNPRQRHAAEDFYRMLEHSFLVSADNAHAWHPNYNEKYDPTNHPVVNGGPVVKINANCKYMTDSRGDAIFRALCDSAGVPCQYFVNHADVAGGSTLGNILTSQLDIAGVDMGCAIWAMHSACETGGADDILDTICAFTAFYNAGCI